jgi:hypothetical protein
MMAGKKSAAERRNPLTPPDESLVSVWHEVITQIADPERLEERPTKERKREWEKSHPHRCYRGVPSEVRGQVKEVAEELGVPVDEVARAFIEYSLMCVQRGSLTLSGMPSQRRVRMTLYPFTGAGWAENGWTPHPPRRTKKHSGQQPALWREAAYYRLPDELHEQVKRLAGNVYPVGELVAVLLKHGLENYNAGVLVLIPQPKTGASLEWTGGTK